MYWSWLSFTIGGKILEKIKKEWKSLKSQNLRIIIKERLLKIVEKGRFWDKRKKDWALYHRNDIESKDWANYQRWRFYR